MRPLQFLAGRSAILATAWHLSLTSMADQTSINYWTMFALLSAAGEVWLRFTTWVRWKTNTEAGVAGLVAPLQYAAPSGACRRDDESSAFRKPRCSRVGMVNSWTWIRCTKRANTLELPGVEGLRCWLPVHVYTDSHFEWKFVLNFNAWVKFQTIRHLTPSSFRLITTL